MIDLTVFYFLLTTPLLYLFLFFFRSARLRLACAISLAVLLQFVAQFQLSDRPVLKYVPVRSVLDQSGIEAGDQIVTVNGSTVYDIRSLILALKPDAKNTVQTQAGKSATLPTMQKLTAVDETSLQELLGGASLTDRPALIRYLPGVQVRNFLPNTLTRPVRIMQIQGQAVETVRDVIKVLQSAQSGQLLVTRLVVPDIDRDIHSVPVYLHHLFTDASQTVFSTFPEFALNYLGIAGPGLTITHGSTGFSFIRMVKKMPDNQFRWSIVDFRSNVRTANIFPVNIEDIGSTTSAISFESFANASQPTYRYPSVRIAAIPYANALTGTAAGLANELKQLLWHSPQNLLFYFRQPQSVPNQIYLLDTMFHRSPGYWLFRLGSFFVLLSFMLLLHFPLRRWFGQTYLRKQGLFLGMTLLNALLFAGDVFVILPI